MNITTVLFGFLCASIAAAAPISQNAARQIGALRGNYTNVAAEYRNLHTATPPNLATPNPTDARLKEFIKQSDAFEYFIPRIVYGDTIAGSSKTWNSVVRLNEIPIPVAAARTFNNGPGNSVVPFSGEFEDSISDFSLPQRGGLGFAFERKYTSFSMTDFGLGIGWDYNFNATIRQQGESELLLHWQGRDITFKLLGGTWQPQVDEFFSIETTDSKISVLTPDLMRIEFEPALDTHTNETKHWRLSGIASRHDKHKANRIEVSYLQGCDRISHVNDPFNQIVKFAYDDKAHIVQVASDHYAVNFSYDDAGHLIEAKYPERIISLCEKVDRTIKYSYHSIVGHQQLGRKCSSGFPYELRIEYDGHGRVKKCGYYGKEIQQVWDYIYEKNNEVVVLSPVPTPKMHYFFGSPAHPSLPQKMTIPARKAEWQYKYATNLQLAEEVDPLGVKTEYRYNLSCTDPKFRGNLLSTRTLPAAGAFTYWKETGIETQYHPEIALPIRSEIYQVDLTGIKTVAKYETTEYSPDYTPMIRSDNGIVTRLTFNRYGEIAIEADANNNVTIYKYAEKLPGKTNYAFIPGSVTNGGLLVSRVQDATKEQVRDACNALSIPQLMRNEITRIKPIAMETQTVWDAYGNIIRTSEGHSQTLYINTPDGLPLASFENATGLKLYSYSAMGKTLRVAHEFCPNDYAGAYMGEKSPHFSGQFYLESLTYDELGQISSRVPSSETAQTNGKIRCFSFERYANGKIKSITNPDGIKRVDRYSPETGELHAQAIESQSGTVLLQSDLTYYPNGSVRSFRDQFGGIWETLLDGFGLECGEISPDKVTTRQKADAAGRILLQTVEADSAVISKRENAYDSDNGLLDCVTAWQISTGVNKPITMEKYLYDKAGNQIGARGVQDDSWTYFLLDGLNRTVAHRTPSGDMDFVVYEQDAKVYSSNWLYSSQEKKHWKTGMLAAVDHAGRTVLSIPVDRFGKLADERSSTTAYDGIGRIKENHPSKLSKVTYKHNTLGEILEEKNIPLNIDAGERPVTTEYTYSPGGTLLKKSLFNSALWLNGDKNKSVPELVEAPQVTEYKFDEFGRQIGMTQPDGLIVNKTYNIHSQPETMTWTHITDTNKCLRSISFKYSTRGQVISIFDKLNSKDLRNYSYDNFGNCTQSTDFGSGNAIELIREFDSLGLKLCEKLVLNGKKLPHQQITHDLPHGASTCEWKGLTRSSLCHWGKVTKNIDSEGRISSLTLDDAKNHYVEWNYAGGLTELRTLPESGVENVHLYNSFSEPQKTLFVGSNGQQLGNLEYGYGPQGQAEFAATTIQDNGSKPYTYAMYAHFDSFRRLVAQNGEVKIPEIKKYSDRKIKVFGESEKCPSALNTVRMQYDEANNIWVTYSGSCAKDLAPASLKSTQNPLFISAALPTMGKGDLLLRELASNREVSKAAFRGNNDSLTTDEFTYDLLGNLTSYDGHFWNGQMRYPVKWSLEYDTLGRLTKMVAKAKEDTGFVKKDAIAGEMSFVYDAENRRICKTVIDHTIIDSVRTNITYTLFDDTNQAMVFDEKDNLKEQYLWRPGTRELLMAALPMRDAENARTNRINRYFFQQDRGLNVVSSSRVENGQVTTVAAMSYLGFGDNATYGAIKNILSSMPAANIDCAKNQDLDDMLSASWTQKNSRLEFIEIELEKESDISQLSIWTEEKFPKDFLLYILPKNTDSPDSHSKPIENWAMNNKDYCCAAVSDGNYQNKKKEDALDSPYRISLGDKRGNRILIVWDKFSPYNVGLKDIDVKEFEVTIVPDNPGAIAFAGQWLDRESGMYYQINRYKLAGSDKFISPDPIGFLDGNNLYAYAKGNPLEWHDPDGRFAHIFWGAFAGAVLNSGFYTMQCWLGYEEFSWETLAMKAGTGALAGGVAAATFGAVNPWLANAGVNAAANMTLTSGLTGFAGGFTGGFTDTLLTGSGWNFSNALNVGIQSGGWGALGGVITGGMISQTGASFGSTVLSGGVGGGISNGLRSGFESGSLEAGLEGTWKGFAAGSMISGSAWGIGSGTGMLKKLEGYPKHLPDPRQGVMIRTNASVINRTYDGQAITPGYARHHIKPLSLGGRDAQSNLKNIPIEKHSTAFNPVNAHPGPWANQQPMGTIFY